MLPNPIIVNMKIKFFPVVAMLVMLLTAGVCQAKVVNESNAALVANSFVSLSKSKTGLSRGQMKLLTTSRVLMPMTRADVDPCFYVFSDEQSRSFVIVSGDDCCEPIIGYSFDSPFDSENMPENFRQWMEGICGYIQYAREHDVQPSQEVSRQWAKAAAAETVKELKTALWNQHDPYNRQCPMDGAQRSITGCTNTAFGIIMKYYEWPVSGNGVAPAYTTEYKKISVPERDLNHAYDWSNMLMEYKSGNFNNQQADAVATLIADVGHAMQADYSASSTSTYTHINKMYEHFGYSASMTYRYKDDYSLQGWIALLKEHIDVEHPIFYVGQSDKGGHAFILDGYDSNDYFHVNWGWGGYQNGYFNINILKGGDSLYNLQNIAYLNIYPDNGEPVKDWLVLRELNYDGAEYEGEDSFWCEPVVENSSMKDFSGELRLAVVDRNGNLKEWASDSYSKICNSRYHYWFWMKVHLTRERVAGDRLRLFYKSNDSNDWCLVGPKSEISTWEFLLEDEETIDETTTVKFEKASQRLFFTTKKGVKPELLDTMGRVVDNAFNQTEANAYWIETGNLSEGQYTLVLTKRKERKELKFTVSKH